MNSAPSATIQPVEVDDAPVSGRISTGVGAWVGAGVVGGAVVTAGGSVVVVMVVGQGYHRCQTNGTVFPLPPDYVYAPTNAQNCYRRPCSR